jgi:predicted O-methyltransferase YrrM
MRVDLDRTRARLAQRIDRDRTRLARRILPASSRRLTPAPSLESRHVEGCRVVTDFEAMIREHLPKHAVVGEVGTFRGGSARIILEGADPRELHLIDRDFSILDQRMIEPAMRHGIVRLHEEDSAVGLASFPDEYFDWIHIDGDPSYAGVKRDIEQAKRKVKPDGLLLFRYLFFSHNELVAWGVIHAVNELCLADGWAIRYLALQPRMYCHVAVARPTG